ncbi:MULTISPECIES: type VI secretion system baseplate subunit TssK [unclassified Psychrobacter]|uniref:type VI secretion system baseplate subunit TssK n=1 Tax=unclassified Psychrobacter TaxID=196806 RepID=UPI00071E9257|nr:MULTISPECIES: type VI secretion system baseplate subunit TssK [unclassified Psychrobacter]OLF36123.1 type VI secretion system-associated protein [Psychrobacter sp. Cmf 22.2]
MSKHRVLWGEGLFLRPQHFQIQDTYHNSQRALSMMLMQPYAYGVSDVQIDKQLLESNLLSFQSIYAVLPDSTIYQAPRIDALPKGVALDSQDHGDEVFVFLSLEIVHNGGSNIQADHNDNPARYVRGAIEAKDLYSQAAEAVIDVIKLSPSLQLSHSAQAPSRDTLSLLVAKLVRTTQGIYQVDEDYIVPSVHIKSNPALVGQVYRLMTMINTKSTSLYDHHRQSNNDLLEFRSSDIASFWLLHTLNTAYSQLNHLYNNAKLHPERLYEALLNVASQLATFSSLYKVGDLPSYHHDNANESFNSIISIIRELLNTVIASNFISIPLRQNKSSYYTGELSGDKITRSSQLYLSISSSLPMHELIDIVPRRFKVATPDSVEKRVLSALPGSPISHVTQVPSAIPVRPGFSYFTIEPVGELYDEMIKSESICIYVPNGFDDLKIELMAIVQ